MSSATAHTYVVSTTIDSPARRSCVRAGFSFPEHLRDRPRSLLLPARRIAESNRRPSTASQQIEFHVFLKTRQSLKVASKAAEPLHWFSRLPWCNRYIMLAIANVNACCVRMNNIQPRIVCPDRPVPLASFVSDSGPLLNRLRRVTAMFRSFQVEYAVRPGGELKHSLQRGQATLFRIGRHQTNDRQYTGAILLIGHRSANEFVGFSCRTAC